MTHVGRKPRQARVNVHTLAVPVGQAMNGKRVPQVIRTGPYPSVKRFEAQFSQELADGPGGNTNGQAITALAHQQRSVIAVGRDQRALE
jgi:hypothetical protein